MYRKTGRPQEGIYLIVDALEKGEKTGVAARRMRKWTELLVRPFNAILERVPLRLLLRFLGGC